MGYAQIQEPIEVLAHFSPQGVINPLVFSWAGRQYKVEKTTYRWRTGKGRETLRFFAVITRSNNSYQLCYSDENSCWWLERTWTGD